MRHFLTVTQIGLLSNSENMTVSDGRLNASGTDYEAQISQTVGNMENGTYTLNAYLTNDTTDGICYLYAKDKRSHNGINVNTDK